MKVWRVGAMKSGNVVIIIKISGPRIFHRHSNRREVFLRINLFLIAFHTFIECGSIEVESQKTSRIRSSPKLRWKGNWPLGPMQKSSQAFVYF